MSERARPVYTFLPKLSRDALGSSPLVVSVGARGPRPDPPLTSSSSLRAASNSSPPSSPIKASAHIHNSFSPSHYHRNMAAGPAGSSSASSSTAATSGAGPSSSGSAGPSQQQQASAKALPIMHKTTASGHNLSVKIPDGPSSSGASSQQLEHPMLWGMQLRYVSCVRPARLRDRSQCAQLNKADLCRAAFFPARLVTLALRAFPSS